MARTMGRAPLVDRGDDLEEAPMGNGRHAVTKVTRFLMAAMIGAALAGLAGCKDDTIPIRDLLANTTSYDGKTVRVAGTVKSAAGAFGYGVYQVEDATGTITIVTKTGGAPVENSKVGVEGTFRSAFTLGTDTVAIIEETKRATP